MMCKLLLYLRQFETKRCFFELRICFITKQILEHFSGSALGSISLRENSYHAVLSALKHRCTWKFLSIMHFRLVGFAMLHDVKQLSKPNVLLFNLWENIWNTHHWYIHESGPYVFAGCDSTSYRKYFHTACTTYNRPLCFSILLKIRISIWKYCTLLSKWYMIRVILRKTQYIQIRY